MAIVSLVDSHRQWFKSVQGLPVKSTERKVSFCTWTLLPEHPEILVVPNALEDIRRASSPLTGHLHTTSMQFLIQAVVSTEWATLLKLIQSHTC